MKTLLYRIAFVVCAGLALSARAADERKLPEEARAAALSWVGLLDKDQYGQSLKDATMRLRNYYTEATWVAKMTKERKPLGNCAGREYTSAKYSDQLAGNPPGDYWTILFKTQFEKLKAAQESVSLVLDKDGKWRVVAYGVRPAPILVEQ